MREWKWIQSVEIASKYGLSITNDLTLVNSEGEPVAEFANLDLLYGFLHGIWAATSFFAPGGGQWKG